MDLTQGSAVVTAHSGTFPTSLCHGIAAVSVTVANGSASFSGSGLVDGGKIVINGTRNSGTRYTGMFSFTQSGGTSGSLSALWPGDSGTFTALITDSNSGYDWFIAIGSSESDVRLRENWECTYDSPTQITLNREWDFATDTGGTASAYRYLAGYGQQPYMLGIQSQFMNWAAFADIAEATNYASLAASAATWLKDYGFDPDTQGLNYGRVFDACEPTTTTAGNFTFRVPTCSYGYAGRNSARALNGEIGASLGMLYAASPTAANKTWGDLVYGSLWGKPAWTTGGVYSDPYFVATETGDGYIGAYKWAGFFFGMGMAHQWPAARVGGPTAASVVSKSLQFLLSSVPNATKVTSIITRPTGTSTTVTCTSSPCNVSVDLTLGTHSMTLYYYSASNKLLALSDPILFTVN